MLYIHSTFSSSTYIQIVIFSCTFILRFPAVHICIVSKCLWNSLFSGLHATPESLYLLEFRSFYCHIQLKHQQSRLCVICVQQVAAKKVDVCSKCSKTFGSKIFLKTQVATHRFAANESGCNGGKIVYPFLSYKRSAACDHFFQVNKLGRQLAVLCI